MEEVVALEGKSEYGIEMIRYMITSGVMKIYKKQQVRYMDTAIV